MDAAQSPEDAIYKYVTEDKDKILGMAKAHEYYPVVKERLLTEFWETVEKKLHDKFKEDDNWRIDKTSAMNEPSSKLYVYSNEFELVEHNNLPPFFFGFENLQYYPYYGIWINRGDDKFDDEKVIKVRSKFNNQKSMMTLGERGEWWLSWRHINGLDLSRESNIVNLLPEEREQKSEMMVEELSKLIESSNKELTRIFNENKS